MKIGGKGESMLGQDEIDSLIAGIVDETMGRTVGAQVLSNEDIASLRRQTQVLTQEEIDSLLTAIDGYSYSVTPGVYAERFDPNEWIEGLSKRSLREEPLVGMFIENASVIRFRSTDHADEVLADIKALNEKEGGGNIKVPGSPIELINFSRCPNCAHLHSFAELGKYYASPLVDPAFGSRKAQMRSDTRVKCKECGTFFIPALVIADGLPKGEVQFLCKVQTVDATERHLFAAKGLRVLSAESSNVRSVAGKRYIHNDLDISMLTERPGLIVNLLQYSTPPLMVSFIEGKNRERGDMLFGIAV